jgi:threonylcarbamoyladenosine tRNA methylthiotransferase MtaB
MRSNNEISVGIYTLGCKVNQYESEAIAEALQSRGLTVSPPSSVCDAYIINTCTVTAESDRKARQFIRRAIKKNPLAYVLVTGCMAQTSPEDISTIEGVDVIVGNSNKLLCVDELISLIESKNKNQTPKIIVDDIFNAEFEDMAIKRFDRTRAYVKIEDGCENKCTYCIIPNARGKVRSKDPQAVVAEVEELVKNGCREIVLTGIETASYGKDLNGVDLADILCRINNIPNIGRVRLGSLDPSLIRADFVKKISALKCLAPHFHLSLQSGSDRILAKMKRKYNSDMAMKAITLLRESIPNVKFTTDVIVGFPSETEEDYLDTERFIKEAQFLMVHIFPYSKRKGTPAATMEGQLSSETKTERLHRLEIIANSSTRHILEAECTSSNVKNVLFETYRDGHAYGHTDDFIEVAVPSSTPIRSEFRNVRLIYTNGNICFGELI